MRRIIKNAIKCVHCGDIIESRYRHDFVTCSCGCCSVDGGTDYLRRGSVNSRDDFIDLSEFEDDGMVKLSQERQEPILLTRNGDGEMGIELLEKRGAELDLSAEMLRREQNRIAGAKTYSMEDMDTLTEDILGEG